ncbi:MAG: hypothetical protein KDK38_02935 [Leptospiraceae bacterium]|nr:hypothetical protein [Leptospiraceae bacterium]
MDIGLLFPLSIAFLLAVLLTFRSGLSKVLRLLLILTVTGLCVFWWMELFTEYSMLKNGEWLRFLQQTLPSAVISLPWLWAVGLILIFYSGQDRDASVFLIILLVFTFAILTIYAVMTFTNSFSTALPGIHSMRL